MARTQQEPSVEMMSPETLVTCSPEDFGDPDVTGIGVLISFAISITLTIGLLVRTYFVGALRQEEYNAVDDVILSGFHCARGSFDAELQAQRTFAFEAFVQAMANQQLFTGMSLMVAVWMIRYGVTGLDVDISAYSYCIAVNLGLLSFIVHLSATTVLRNHFAEYKELRNARTLITTIALCLLIPAQVTSQLVDARVTVQCAMEQLERSPMSFTDSGIYDRTIIFATTTIVAVISLDYFRRLLELYSPTFRQSPDSCAARFFAFLVNWPTKRARNDFNLKALIHQADLAARLMGQRLSSKKQKAIHMGLVLYIVVNELRRSFFIEIIWLLFYVIFGFTQIAYFFKWGPEPGTSDRPITFQLGFSQILPLVLVASPFLNAYEVYAAWSKQKKRRLAEITKTNGCSHFPALTRVDASIAREISSVHPAFHSKPNLNLGPTEYLDPECTENYINLYRICLERHRKITVAFTWLTVVTYTVVVILAALVFSGIFWSGDDIPENDGAGYVLTIGFALFFLFYWLVSVGGSVSWCWTKRYRWPVEVNLGDRLSCEEQSSRDEESA